MHIFTDAYKYMCSKGFINISHLKEEFDNFGKCALFAYLPRVEWEDW